MSFQAFGKRLLAGLEQHHSRVVWSLLVLGLLAPLMLPLAGKRCYLDEKSLLVGGSFPTVRSLGSVAATVSTYKELAARIAEQQTPLLDLALQAAVQLAPTLSFYRQNFTFPQGGKAAPQQCATLHTVVRAPGSDGTEGLVLWLQGSSGSGGPPAVQEAAVGAGAAAQLQRVQWLAKDVVLVFAEGGDGCEPLAVAQAWVALYNSGSLLFDFPRAGLLQQALVLELPAGSVQGAELRLHGWQGLLPNLDHYYQIKRNLDIHTQLTVTVQPAWLPPPWLTSLAGRAAEALGLGSSGAAAAQSYAAELAAGAAFAMQLAAAEPNGAHGAFLELQVDAATLRFTGSQEAAAASSTGGPSTTARAVESALTPVQAEQAVAQALAAVEMVLRTCNNLQERLHHSTALYLLLAPDRYISIAVYLAAPGLLLAAALGQVLLEARHALAASPASWRSGWRRAAAIHACALVAALAWHSLVRRPGSEQEEPPAPLAQQAALVIGAAAALAWWGGLISPAAVNPKAALACAETAEGDAASGNSSSKSSSSRASSSGWRRPARLAAAALVLMEGVWLLLGHWAICWLLLAATLPLLAATGEQLEVQQQQQQQYNHLGSRQQEQRELLEGSKAGQQGAVRKRLGSSAALLAVASLPAAVLLRACLAWAPGSQAFLLLSAQCASVLACCLLSP